MKAKTTMIIILSFEEGGNGLKQLFVFKTNLLVDHDEVTDGSS